MTRTTHTPLAVRLGSAISEAKFEQLSSETVSRVKLSILDNIGTIAYVSTLEDCAPVLDRVREKGGRAEATVAGQSIKAPLEDASAANAFLIHAAETDESDFRASLRASPVVMAPAMATAESIGATGKDFILSLAVGYSVLGALAAPLGRLQPYGFMSVGVWGTSSAAAVSARLMGLNASQCTHALALAGGGGGLFQYYYDQTEEKRLIVARSVRTGVEAALLARTGMVGPERIYEGEAGVYRVFGKLVGRDVSEREIDNVAEQARRWDGPLYLIPKYYAASASIIPFLDGLDELFQSRPDIRAQVANFELHIEDDPTYILAAKHKAYEHPHTIIGAKINLQFVIALFLRSGTASAADFSEATIEDRDLRSFAEKAAIVRKPRGTKSSIVLVLTSGERVGVSPIHPSTSGFASADLIRRELKFNSLTSRLLDDDQRQQIRRAVDDLETERDMATWFSRVNEMIVAASSRSHVTNGQNEANNRPKAWVVPTQHDNRRA